jgi:hypothetical protein
LNKTIGASRRNIAFSLALTCRGHCENNLFDPRLGSVENCSASVAIWFSSRRVQIDSGHFPSSSRLFSQTLLCKKYCAFGRRHWVTPIVADDTAIVGHTMPPGQTRGGHNKQRLKHRTRKKHSALHFRNELATALDRTRESCKNAEEHIPTANAKRFHKWQSL